VAAVTEIEAGIKKATVSVVPVPGVTLLAVVVTGVPPLLGVSVTVTLAGEIVPLGNPEPVTETLVSPACPEVGLVAAFSVTLACAKTGMHSNTAPTNERTVARIELMPVCPHHCYS
jgi:hypothetical protein